MVFDQKDLASLSEVFAAARSYVVTSRPDSRDHLVNLLNFEEQLVSKITQSLAEPTSIDDSNSSEEAVSK